MCNCFLGRRFFLSIFKTVAFIFLIIALGFLLNKAKQFTISTFETIQDAKKNEIKQCFLNNGEKQRETDKSVIHLPDILNSTRFPKLDESIFFIDTSCAANGMIKLSARQACSIESAAKLNPNRDIFVLFAGYTKIHFDSERWPPQIKALFSYSNVHLRNINLFTYTSDTPVANWIGNSDIFFSPFFLEHLSDLMRLVTMYRYGGTYLDTDIIIQKQFDINERNFAGAEDSQYITNSVLNFKTTGIGHAIAELCLRRFQQSYNPDAWSVNGPILLTSVLENICKTNNFSLMTPDRCQGFKIYSPEYFFPIYWPYWEELFNPNLTSQVLNKTKNSVGIHLSNKLSKSEPFRADSAYDRLSSKYCPEVYRLSSDYF